MFTRDRPVTFNICSSRTGACSSNAGNFGVVRDSDLNGGDYSEILQARCRSLERSEFRLRLMHTASVISSEDITYIIKARLETMRSKRRMDSEESKPARTRWDVVHLEL